MPGRIWIFRLAVALLLVGLLAYRASGPRGSGERNSRLPATRAETAPAPSASKISRASAIGETVLKLHPGEVLASVNSREITAKDLVPLNERDGEKETELPLESYQYLIDRAVNRELIFQAAKSAGIELDESQKDQLASLKSLR